MHIILAYETGEPIYEQIKNQIRSQIIGGTLSEDSMLPSIRTLAKELKVGVITAKRAYEDLCTEGFLYSVQGKGIFVSKLDSERTECYAVNVLKEKFAEIKKFAAENSVNDEKLKEIYKEIIEKEKWKD